MSSEEAPWLGWGRWQARLALLLALPVLLTGAYGTNYVFLAAPAEFRCFVPECESNPGRVVPAEELLPEWSAWALAPDTRCRRRAPVADACAPASFGNATVQCDRFVYQQTSSIVADFDLACAEWRRTLVGAAHNLGMLVSLPLMGMVSDRLGRRAALAASAAGAGAVGVAKSFARSYGAYVAAEFLETVAGASVYPVAFVLMLEWLCVRRRALASLALGLPLALGAAGLPLLDYLCGSWRVWARVAYPPSVAVLLYPRLLPHSARWLLARGRAAEARDLVREAARCNGVRVSEEMLEQLAGAEKSKDESAEEGLFAALCKYSSLRRRLAVCCVWWWSAVLVFYGVAVRAHALPGAPRVTFALLAAAEAPALAANTLLLARATRRAALTAALLLTSAALTAMAALPVPPWCEVALFLAGKAGATMCLNTLYVYSAELFPTRARQRLLAASSAAGRVGAVLAPLTPLLAAYGSWVPAAQFGALPLLSAALTPLVPDTLRARLPDTFADLQRPPAADTDTADTA